MASIHRKGDRWRVMYRVDGRQRTDLFTTHEAALRHRARVESLGGEAARAVLDAIEGVGAHHADTTLATYALAVVAARDGITDGTRVDYLRMVRNRIAGTALGELPLEAVTRDACTAWVRDLTGTAKTRRNYHALLSSILNAAVEAGDLPANPAAGIKVRSSEAPSRRVFLTAGESAVLVAALPVHYQPLVITLLGTGMRFGEATALLVGDVDLDAPTPVLYVRRAWKRSGHGTPTEVGAPKTRAGVRTISLGAGVVDSLAPLVDGRPADELVFTTPAGKPIQHSHFHSRVWKPTVERLAARVDADGNPRTPDLAKRPTVHSLRHTHASALIQSGIPLTVIQRRLGHESIQTTSDVYGHLAPDALAVSAHAIDAWMTQVTPELEG